jgi:stage V sporulation protein AC
LEGDGNLVKVKQEGGLPSQQAAYSQLVSRMEPKPPRLANAVRAFLAGGIVCIVGEGLTDFFERVLNISHKEAGNPAVAGMILIGALLTGMGHFDKLARWAGAGLAVPVTGFANSMVATALEFKQEGLVYGIGGRMFQLAGAVIVFGVVTAFVVGIVYALASGYW